MKDLKIRIAVKEKLVMVALIAVIAACVTTSSWNESAIDTEKTQTFSSSINDQIERLSK